MAKSKKAAHAASQDVPKDREVTVQWPNVWTSKGKKKQGDTVTLSASEIKGLGAAVK